MRESIESGWLTQGPKVAAFERDFAKYHNVRYAIACTSCTTGLHLTLAALGIGPGDEVVIPAFTWIATANVVLYCGATPVFVDVDLNTFNMDPAEIAGKITERTKAIIPVHLFGLCADMEAIRALVPDTVKIIEDAACASGARHRDQFAGGIGDAGVFSFHPRKSITTGEGGMVTTNDSALAERVDALRNHGASLSEEKRHLGAHPYILPDFEVLGFNYRMTDLQGAVGVVQLGKLSRFIDERSEWAAFYRDKLGHLEWLRLPEEPAHGLHAWQAFVTTVDSQMAPFSRNEIMDRLQQKGISVRPGTHAVHMLSLYKNKYGLSSNEFPRARYCDESTMAIPLHNRMTSEDYDYVVEALCQL